MHITFLGSGAAYSNGERRNSSLLIHASGQYLLVDCGGHVAVDIRRHGVSISDITKVILTHSHVDHIFGLPSLLHCLWLDSLPEGGAKVTIYGNDTTLSVTTQLLDLFALRTRPHAPQINFVPLANGSPVCALGDTRVESVVVSHGSIPTNGLVLQEGQKRVVFSSDSEVCASIEERVDATTLLIHDCCGEKGIPAHAGAAEIGALCARRRPRRVILTHLPGSRVADANALATEVARLSGCKVISANDGLTVSW